MAAGLPSAILVELELTAGVWTDVATLVDGDSIEIAPHNAAGGTLDLDLDNADGRFNPDNPTSPYYPNFIEGIRIRVRVTKSATTYVRFVGWIDTITPDYPTEPAQSKVHVGAIDLPGVLDRTPLESTLIKSAALSSRGYLGADVAFYPLDDDKDSGGAVDITGRASNLTGQYVSNGGAIEWATTSGLDADGSSFLKLTAGKRVRHAAPAFRWDHTGVTQKAASGFFFLEDGSYGEVFALTLRERSGAGTYLSVVYDASGIHCDNYVDGSLESSTSAVTVDSGWNCLGLVTSSGTITLNVNGTNAGTTVTPSNTTPYACLSIGGTINVSAANVGLGTGTTPTFLRQIVLGSGLTIQTLRDICDGVTSLTYLDADCLFSTAGDSRAATSIATDGKTALDLYRALADSNGGYLYMVPSAADPQALTIMNLADFRPTAVALTVDAEVDLDGGPTLERWIGDRVGRATAQTPEYAYTAVDSDSTVGDANNDPLVLAIESEAFVQAAATDRLARGAQLRNRLVAVPIDLANAGNDLYAAFFALTPGERVRVTNLPTTFFGLSYVEGYVEGWTERPGTGGYQVVLELSPADAPRESVWDTGRWAFGDGVCTVTGGTAVGTTSTGTMTLTWGSGALLTTAAGDYPMDFDWNGERVTVTSAPAGGSSPRTLTITARGVAPTVARVHAAGEPIEPWDVARWAL